MSAGAFFDLTSKDEQLESQQTPANAHPGHRAFVLAFGQQPYKNATHRSGHKPDADRNPTSAVHCVTAQTLQRRLAMSTSSLRFRDLLYRFYFYGWLFKDAAHGNMWERSAALRHNQQQSKWLPTYMRRWWFLCGLFFGAAMLTEVVFLSPALSALFYVPSILTVPYNLVTFVAWLFLSRS